MSPITVRLRALRRQRGWSQRELARRTGLRPATIIDIERGRTTPTLATLEKLARAFGVPVKKLLAEGPATT